MKFRKRDLPFGAPSLFALQDSFAASVVSGQADELFAATIEETPGFDRAERLGVYSDAYRIRLREALAEDFEATAALLGDAAFRKIADAYIDAHPSGSWTIGDASAAFPAFLLRETPGRRLSPCLAELARFEWAIVESLYAPELSEEAMAKTPDPETLAQLSPSLAPSVQLFLSDWPVAQLWRGRSELGPRSIPREPRSERSLVFRNSRWVVAELLEPTEFVLLEAAQRRLPLEEWPEAVSRQGLDLAKFDVAGAFAKWRSGGILIFA